MNLKTISDIIDDILKDEIFEKVNRNDILEYLNARLDIFPSDITYEQLFNRIRKIISIEAMSHLLDGLTQEQIEDLEKSWKNNREINVDIDDYKLLDLTILLDNICETWYEGWELVIPDNIKEDK